MMKAIIIFLSIALFPSVTACSDDSASSRAPEHVAAAASTPDAGSSNGEESIIGEWEQILTAGDGNGDGKLGEDERKKGTTMSRDYMKLNSDGSALFFISKAKGRYEINVNQSSGNRYLIIFAEDGTKYRKGAIISVSKTELVLLNKSGGDSYTVWKRL